MTTIAEAKMQVQRIIDALDSRLREIALLIHANPELGLEEHKAVQWLTTPLRQAGFEAAQHAAESVGAGFEFEEGLTYADFRKSVSLGALFTENMRTLGIEIVEPSGGGTGGSSDIGNVSQVTVAIHPYIKISDVAANHTPEFCEASASEQAMQALNHGVKALAMTALDLCLNPEAMEQVRAEFKQQTQAAGAGPAEDVNHEVRAHRKP